LARHFIKSFCKEQGRKILNLSDDAVQKLLKYKYPGNVRELKATIELAVIMADGDTIQSGNLNFIPVETQHEEHLENMTMEEHIERIVRNSLMKHNNNPTEVSRVLGISRATIYRYIKKFEF
jgi:two-component system, NtrC family, response regulator AtoC